MSKLTCKKVFRLQNKGYTLKYGKKGRQVYKQDNIAEATFFVQYHAFGKVSLSFFLCACVSVSKENRGLLLPSSPYAHSLINPFSRR